MLNICAGFYTDFEIEPLWSGGSIAVTDLRIISVINNLYDFDISVIMTIPAGGVETLSEDSIVSLTLDRGVLVLCRRSTRLGTREVALV